MITKTPFINTKGISSDLYTLTAASGFSVAVTPFACRLVSIFAKDKNGSAADVLLGYENPNDYVDRFVSFYGVTLGRYANRIAGASLTIDGETYSLVKNEGRNTCHGGDGGFHRLLWEVESTEDGAEPSVTLRHFSPDGDQGFPGNVTVRVKYTVKNDDTLRIDYLAETDKATALNLSSHGYFNITGDLNMDTRGVEVQINADCYTPVDEENIPTGELRPVEGTAFDFRAPKAIGADIDDPDESMRRALGYDHNFCVRGEGFRQMAVAHDPGSGRVMEIWADTPGIQFYSVNTYDDDLVLKGGIGPKAQQAFCLEPGCYPDAPNKDNFPFKFLRPDEKYHSAFEYRFSVK